MNEKTIIKTTKFRSLMLTIQHVFRANFNDTYWLEEKSINLEELNNKDYYWFDPYNGRSKFNNTKIALKYVSDEKFIILENINGVITEHEKEVFLEYIACEDFDQSVLLACHVNVTF